MDDEVTVVAEDTGDVVVHVGEEISLHGTTIDESIFETINLDQPLPEACADAVSHIVIGLDTRKID